MDEPDTIAIEVVFATASRQELLQVNVPKGSTIAEVVRLSGIGELFPGENLVSLPKGIWNEQRPDDFVVSAGDRVEIYRNLVTDAREARRKRAAEQKAKKPE